ncbi:hypothetical protein O3W44_00005, partial [Pantoea sp. LMR881]|uniref:hypothetical protein n=1 Tax=Pantoea sp. LMR881 TaxID=3014336 RepID=UPI0022B056A4
HLTSLPLGEKSKPLLVLAARAFHSDLRYCIAPLATEHNGAAKQLCVVRWANLLPWVIPL